MLIYISFLTPAFPIPPSDSVQSTEPGDSEAVSVRRAYFTNFTRSEVLEYYENQLRKVSLFGINIPLPTYRLNYPPEDAQTLIRDQTRSTFLEEIVHPLRESFFVNGFEPKVAKDDIWYKGVHYRQKITVKYNRSNLPVRLVAGGLTILAAWLVIKGWQNTCRDIRRLTKGGKNG